MLARRLAWHRHRVRLLTAADAELLLVGLAACGIPLRRARRIKPTKPLRHGRRSIFQIGSDCEDCLQRRPWRGKNARDRERNVGGKHDEKRDCRCDGDVSLRVCCQIDFLAGGRGRGAPPARSGHERDGCFSLRDTRSWTRGLVGLSADRTRFEVNSATHLKGSRAERYSYSALIATIGCTAAARRAEGMPASTATTNAVAAASE